MKKNNSMDNINILIVEDNEGDAILVQELLEGQKEKDFKCSSVESIADSMELIKENSFDVVILDLDLPDGKGFDTFSKIKEVAPEVPILILSGSTMKRDEFKQCLNSADDYLVKGYLDSPSLVAAICTALDKKKTV